MKLKITQKVLYNQAKPIDFQSPWQNQQLADNMLRLMRKSHGIGLAAPQCGVSRRFFVMEIQGQQWCCYNPEISRFGNVWVEFDEGCLSFPGEHCIIKRAYSIEVRYQNHQGKWHSETLAGLPSRCFQHEYDHLEGITMWQRKKEHHAKQS